MDIELRDLELLEALDLHQTLTAAAERLFVSQPALSQRLLRLEQRLATPLFDRVGRRLVPTPAGRRMLRAARSALHEMRDAVRDISELRTGEREVVKVWSQCSTNYQWLPEVLQTFRRDRPTADVTIETLTDADHIPALLDGRLDVALVSKFDQRTASVRLTRLFDDELVAVVTADHPWAGRPFVDADDFADQHLVLYDAYDPTRVPRLALPIPPGATPARLSTLPLVTDLLIETIIGSGAVTVLPSWVAAPHLGDGSLASVQVGRTPQARTWYAATRHGIVPAHIEAFVDALVTALGRGDHERPHRRAA